MAKVTLMGRDFDVEPYKIKQMRKAAPFIDTINTTTGAMSTIGGLVDAASAFCAVLSIGLVRLDETLTPDALEDMIGFGDLPALRDAFTAILQESGMASAGEAPAPVSEQVAGA